VNKFDITKTTKIIFVSSDKNEMTMNVDSIKKIDSIINEYHFLGHIGNENCSGTDVGLEFRSVPNECKEHGRMCCEL
jgi:hypothetical protein